MGNNCSNFQLKDECNFLYELQSPTFGTLKLMHNPKTNKDIALKYFNFSSQQQLKNYSLLINKSKSYQKIPTLLKVLNCTSDNRLNCSYGCYISFEFHKKTLDNIIKQKKMLLSEFLVMNPHSKSLNHLKFYDYERIDQNNLIERKYCNIHFLEIEVLRIIDHVLGAAFFLYHVNQHQQQNAIRPENVIVDQEGRHLLADKEIFKIQTNYELALYENKLNYYLAPEQLKLLKNKVIDTDLSHELTDIFSIGVIALEMCTLDSLTRLYDFQQMRINVLQMNRLLSNANQHYSADFMELLQKMLKVDKNERIDYCTLIDSLSPVLMKNLQQMNKVYGSTWCKDDSISNKAKQDRISDIHQRLGKIDQQYSKVMNTKVIQKPYNLKEQYFARQQENVLKRLKQAQQQRNTQHQQIKGNQLYDMCMKQYNSISKSRTKVNKK